MVWWDGGKGSKGVIPPPAKGAISSGKGGFPAKGLGAQQKGYGSGKSCGKSACGWNGVVPGVWKHHFEKAWNTSWHNGGSWGDSWKGGKPWHAADKGWHAADKGWHAADKGWYSADKGWHADKGSGWNDKGHDKGWEKGSGKGPGKGGFKVIARNADSTVWLGGIPEGVTYQEIQTNFQSAGTVRRVQILKNGTGFVWFSSAEEAKEAIRMFNGSKINGSPLQVDHWTRKS
mmetsp:Transcript_92986/g.216119  ORF Transcript_92986/g.216119 Transcript_92986/m.216119 type:complete len:231 (+) Transcript_92986:102-794(+)